MNPNNVNPGGNVGLPSPSTAWRIHGLPPYSLGYANFLGFLLIAPVAFFTAPAGAAIAHMADRSRLRKMFALFVAVTAAKMLWDAL